MDHYTLTSGQRTDTVTSRCPICCKVRYYTIGEQHSGVGLGRELFCCHAHGVAFDKRLIALLRRAAYTYDMLYDQGVQRALATGVINDPFFQALITRYITEYGYA